MVNGNTWKHYETLVMCGIKPQRIDPVSWINHFESILKSRKTQRDWMESWISQGILQVIKKPGTFVESRQKTNWILVCVCV